MILVEPQTDAFIYSFNFIKIRFVSHKPKAHDVDKNPVGQTCPASIHSSMLDTLLNVSKESFEPGYTFEAAIQKDKEHDSFSVRVSRQGW